MVIPNHKLTKNKEYLIGKILETQPKFSTKFEFQAKFISIALYILKVCIVPRTQSML